MMPHIVIIVLHYKNLADTKDCLRSLQKVDYNNFSVIVVNNDSRGEAESLRAEFGSSIAIIQNDANLGFSEGNNVGIRAALADSRTNAVLILNNDTEVEPNFLSEMANVQADMVAPKMRPLSGRDKIDNLGLTLMGSGIAFNRRKESEKLFCPSGAAALYSRRLLEAIQSPPWRPVLRSIGEGGGGVGGGEYFDPSFFAYCEDLDLGFRARLAGFMVGYADKAIVYHRGSAGTKPMSDFAVYHTYRNLIWTHFKNMPLPLLLWQSPWLAAGWLFLFALYTLKGRPGIILSAGWDGALGLRFMLKKRREVQHRRAVSNKTILSWFATGLFPKSYLK